MKAKLRVRLLSLHRWLGIHLAVLLLVVCATGTLAVVGHELDWLVDPAHRASVADMNWGAAHQTLQRELPEHEVEAISSPPAPGHAAVAFVASPTGQRQRVLLDPAEGRARGVRHLISPQVYLRQLHKSLLIPKGIYLVGLLGSSLAYALLSGLLVYPAWWRKLGRWRLRAKPTIKWSDLHRTGGVWIGAFALIIAATGMWYFIESAAHDVADLTVERPAPSRTHEGPASRDASAPPSLMTAGEAVALARATLPDLEPTLVTFPHTPDEPIGVYGRRGNPWLRDRANRVYLDPYSKQVLEVRRVEDASTLHVWSDLADELHFGTLGEYGGSWSKTLYVLLGLGLSIVIVAGPRLALERQRARGRPSTRRPSRTVRWAERAAAIVTAAAVIAAVTLTWLGQFDPMLTGRGDPELRSRPGTFETATYVVDAYPFEEEAIYVLRWSPAPPPALRSAHLVAGDDAPAIDLHGFRNAEGFAALDESPRLRLVDSRGVSDEHTLQLAPRPGGTPPAAFSTVEIGTLTYGFVWSVVAAFVALAIATARWLWRPLTRLTSDAPRRSAEGSASAETGREVCP